MSPLLVNALITVIFAVMTIAMSATYRRGAEVAHRHDQQIAQQRDVNARYVAVLHDYVAVHAPDMLMPKELMPPSSVWDLGEFDRVGAEDGPPPPPATPPPPAALSPERDVWEHQLTAADRAWFRLHMWDGPGPGSVTRATITR